MNKIKISSNTKWEDIVGYSRAVRAGAILEVAGTTAVDGDKIIGKDEPFDQAMFIFDKIEKALLSAGACLLYTSPSPRDATLSRMPSSA